MLRKGIGIALIACSAVAQKLVLQPGSTLTIEGTSTLHAWKAAATELALAGHATASPGPLRWTLVDAVLRIPVHGLKSGTEGLDRNMYEDLKAERYPVITFRLKECLPAGEPKGSEIPVRVTGWLTVAGKERLVEIPATWVTQGQRIRVMGSTTLRMTDFGIKPRTFMVVMKVHDPVRVDFDVLFEVR